MSVLDPFVTRVKTDLDGVLQMTQMINGIMMTGDSRANQIIVELYDHNGRVRLDPSSFEPVGENKIVGYFIRGDGYTVEIDGSVNENGEPTITIPRAAYECTGALSIAIRVLSEKQIIPIIDPETGEPTGDNKIQWNSKIVVAALSCFVQNTETDSIIDPDHRIPDVQELLAYIDALEHQYSVISEQEHLRVLAEQGRVSADQQRTANTNQAISDMADATTAMESTIDDAIDDMEDEVRASTDKIDNMTVSASGLPFDSNPTATITEVDGHKHIAFGLVSGHPFAIKKTFHSIAEMEAYDPTQDPPEDRVNVGDMVIIVNTIEDPDNAKLYVRTSSGWGFIVDMSGATGIQGPKGETGNGIASAVLNADYTLTLTWTDGNFYTTPSIRGEKGETGDRTYVDSIDYDYAVGDNSYDTPVSWVSTMPNVPQGKYLWTRSTVTFYPSGSSVGYSVARQGIDGGGGTVRSVNGVSPDANGDVLLVRIQGTRLIIG